LPCEVFGGAKHAAYLGRVSRADDAAPAMEVA
jgi:hypothetical protein